jgi:hypothetical protein
MDRCQRRSTLILQARIDGYLALFGVCATHARLATRKGAHLRVGDRPDEVVRVASDHVEVAA